MGNFMLNRPGYITLMDFFEIFTSGRYHRDMKNLKILASNSKRFRFSGISKKWQIDDREGAHPNTTFY